MKLLVKLNQGPPIRRVDVSGKGGLESKMDQLNLVNMKTCPLCKELFDCQPKGECWCLEIEHGLKKKEDSSECLCKVCSTEKTRVSKKNTRLAPRSGQRPALPFDRGVARTISYLDRFNKKPSR